jgi:hypothetical protein
VRNGAERAGIESVRCHAALPRSRHRPGLQVAAVDNYLTASSKTLTGRHR